MSSIVDVRPCRDYFPEVDADPNCTVQESLIGDNSILCENIGHTYSSLGDYEKAREYFSKGLALLGPDGPPGRQAGFYYGLGLATDRLGSARDSLPLLHKALEVNAPSFR
jgi:tetratricopeptide (TPR) repeat protein